MSFCALIIHITLGVPYFIGFGGCRYVIYGSIFPKILFSEAFWNKSLSYASMADDSISFRMLQTVLILQFSWMGK